MARMIPIRLVVDGELVRRENAEVVALGADLEGDTQWQDNVRLSGVRKRKSKSYVSRLQGGGADRVRPSPSRKSSTRKNL